MTISKHTQAVANLAENATATVTFSTDLPAVDETIIIIDAVGLSKTYIAKGSETASSLQFNRASTKAAAATSLKACIEHANGHNGSVTVVDDSAGKLTLTQATAGAAGNTVIVSILSDDTGDVTVSSYHGAFGFTGGEVGGADNNGGVIAGAGTVSGNNRQITSKSVLDTVAGVKDSGARLALSTGTANQPGIQAAFVAGGTFAFTPDRAARSKTNTGFVMKYAPSDLGSKSNIGWAGLSRLAAGVTSQGIRSTKVKTYGKGTWATQVFNFFGNATGGVTYPGHTFAVTNNDSGLRQSDGTAKSGITNRGTASNYDNIRGSGNIDDSAQPAGGARAIPGEFIILHNFVDYDGASTSGDGTGSENMMDYSAITG